MKTVDQPHTFVQAALAHGIARPDIEHTLLGAGWSRPQVRSALAAFADVPSPIPVPRPRTSIDARDAFLYLVLFGTLYISAINLGGVAFNLIDRTWPDPAALRPTSAAMMLNALRWSLAAVIVASPVFVAMSAWIARTLRRDPVRRESFVRRWLTYITLALASGVLIGDLIALVFGLLSGDLALRFALKVGVVALLSGAVLTYYLTMMRNDDVE